MSEVFDVKNCKLYRADKKNTIIYAELNKPTTCFYCKAVIMNMYFVASAEFTKEHNINVCNTCFRKNNNKVIN